MSTYVNPRPQPVRLVLSDGTERTVRAWGLAFLPDSVHLVRAEFDQEAARQPVASATSPAKSERKAA
jgi:hypothetical protein